ncbi:hypothetical protein PYW08_009560 [Mythimna loreyi]|uniref:Uncharacterized protein n=1 Tax=Mythimna loreyi TaxID=667449 RepID=A0ACC2Q8P3_9NEOP|nr:hypothetical protein PYW08_009560 [Mythimna loreyi]
MILNVLLILMLLKLSRCSLVFDSMSQNTLYVSSYCPAMKNCVEGSHVICQYYNHHRSVGSLCKNYVKVSITPQMVQQILEGVNKIRMKLATGQETGKDKYPLPRAYGMMRMHWDSELATLAQVLADQCLGLKEDNCRATDKFPNPSQIITLINFKAPNWEYLSGNTTKLGLDKEKLRSSIDKALNSLHGIKRLITSNDINSCPKLEALPDKGSRSYLKLIRGKATHIGCGISAYTRSQVLSSGLQHIYNSVQLVCNVSEGPQGSRPVYTTDPPIPDTGFTEKCGCPEGYRDSVGCLCEKDTHGNIENSEIRHMNKYDMRSQTWSHETEGCTDINGNCDVETNMVVLPIFEIQDAPNDSYEPESDVEMKFHQNNKSFIQRSMEGKDNEILDDDIYPEKESRFLKAHTNHIRNHDYRRGKLRKQYEKEFVSYEGEPTSIEGEAKKYEHGYTNNNKHNPKQISDYDDKTTANDEYVDNTEEENSFLTILDRLEKAVKNIELEDEEKEIFDLKMRKIYEATLKSKIKHESDELGDEFKKLTEYLKHKADAALFDKMFEEDESDHFNRRENDSDEFSTGIDKKLIQILRKKHNDKKDYISNHGDTAGRDDDVDAIANDPVPRKQENINKYDADDILLKKEKADVEIRNLKKLNAAVHLTKSHYKENNINKEINKNNMRKLHKNNQVHAVKALVRKMFLYPEKRKKLTSPGYRRVFEVSIK